MRAYRVIRFRGGCRRSDDRSSAAVIGFSKEEAGLRDGSGKDPVGREDRGGIMGCGRQWTSDVARSVSMADVYTPVRNEQTGGESAAKLGVFESLECRETGPVEGGAN